MITNGMWFFHMNEENDRREAEERKTAERRARIKANYQHEIETARARGWTDTAARIEAERDEWLATPVPQD